jgi:hypothetical protein
MGSSGIQEESEQSSPYHGQSEPVLQINVHRHPLCTAT